MSGKKHKTKICGKRAKLDDSNKKKIMGEWWSSLK